MRINSLKIINLIVSVALLPLIALANTQDTLHLDLALNDPGSIKSIQGNRSYDIILLENTVADFSYSIEITSTSTMLPKLEFDHSSLQDVKDIPNNCSSLVEKIKELENFQSPPEDYEEPRNENALSKLVNNLKSQLKQSDCEDIGILNNARYWLSTTKKPHEEKINIETGEKITIIVHRDTLKWTFIFNGDERGKWITTYGFGFTSSKLEGSNYFTKQVPDTTVFEILKARDNKYLDLNYVPAVFFSYFPKQNFNDCWNHSLTAGLGFDLSAPVVFFGYSGLFYHNIGISAGVAFQQQYRLKDQYSENEILSLTLDKDQLHDKIYRPNVFVSINFRFGENPFKSNTEEDSE